MNRFLFCSRLVPLGTVAFALSGAPILAQTTDLASAPASVPAPVRVDVDGTIVPIDPPPLLEEGRVFVPLRGVLENLGARVNYVAADRRIEINQAGRAFVLRPGEVAATVDGRVTAITAPRVVNGRAFVPLRSLAELFGYRVNWLADQRVVAIAQNVPTGSNARQALEAAGPYGIVVDFENKTAADVPALLDAAKNAGAGLIKTRFDWGTVEPEKGTYDWTLFDAVVREAKARNLVVVGILGNTAPWASVTKSTIASMDERKQSPPRTEEYASWRSYVAATVARYRADVRAWQVWDNPNAQNLRSIAKTYRVLARDAIESARRVYPPVIIHVAEPGGVNLQFLRDLKENGLTPLSDGVSVYPVSGWQAGTVAAPEEFLRPYSILREQLLVGDKKTRDYWIGGFSYPVVRAASETEELSDDAKRRFGLFTEAAQADYVVKMAALGLASGTEKLFYDVLQDEESAPSDGLIIGSGLRRADGTPRLSYSAFQTFTRVIGRRPFKGAASFDNNAVALLFDDGVSGVIVAWSPRGKGLLRLDPTGTAQPVNNVPVVATRPDSQLLNSSGQALTLVGGALELSSRPIFVTNVGYEAVGTAQPITPGRVQALQVAAPYANAEQVSATFAENGTENGISWRRFLNFGGAAQEFVRTDRGQYLATQARRDIWDLTSQKPFIYLDVADEFLFNAPGVPVEVTVEVQRPPAREATVFSSNSGFRIEYDSPTGFKSTPWQLVEGGEGWATYSFTLPDVSFSNARGYDLTLNAGGSKTDLVFGAITIRKIAPDAPITASQNNTEIGVPVGETPAPNGGS